MPDHEPLTDALGKPGFWQRDPWSHYARLRSEAPVAWNEPTGYWALSGYDEVLEVSTDSQRFSSAQGILTMEIGIEYPSPPTMMHTDPPEHTAYRKLVAPAFRPSRMDALEARIHERATELVDRIRPGGEVDFVPTVSVPFPLWIIAELLGLPEADWERFYVWSEAMIPGAMELTADERDAIRVEMRDYFMAMIAERRDAPAEDLISDLVQSELADSDDAGRSLDDDELFMFLNQLLVAGNETTRNLISGGLVELADRPDQWARLRDERSLVPAAVEEMLRWTTPVISFMRTATTDTTLGGVDIAAGEPVLMLYASANRDAAQFGPDADEFRIDRDPNHHLAFGFGAHFCIGAALARLEVRILLDQLLDRFKTVERVGDVEWSPSDIIAGVTKAPLVFT